jgi:hypothetical protein
MVKMLALCRRWSETAASTSAKDAALAGNTHASTERAKPAESHRQAPLYRMEKAPRTVDAPCGHSGHGRVALMGRDFHGIGHIYLLQMRVMVKMF